jgi:rhodanese-related sulfurtransferase
MTRRFFDTATDTARGYRELRPSELPGGPLGVRVIDVRERSEFIGELGHIPGAELVPLSTGSTVAASWPRDQELLLVCRSGGRSARAAQQLCAMGFRRVVNLVGGMLAYQAEKLPVARAY